ncbi:MAG: hypothetical protein FWG71_10360 [Synergistaceae bacterium]|nr:hypothetical protein [Synergistaceae bacterium]
MKKIYLLFMSFLIIPACCVPAEARLYIAEPVLVSQPSYAGMRFYVYKPYNMPEGWYATFDGYPVYKNKDGVWVYGTYAGPNLIPTHYVVGSVVPSMAGLVPYMNPVQISSVSNTPQLVSQPPLITAGKLPSQSTYMPDWLFNGRFMALGRWKDSVDRIGVLHRVNIPVAWRGNSPKVIYAWNGHSWHQMLAREGQRPARVLRNNLYTLTRQVKQHGFIWYEADMPVLSQQAAQWGYYWMGEVMPR